MVTSLGEAEELLKRARREKRRLTADEQDKVLEAVENRPHPNYYVRNAILFQKAHKAGTADWLKGMNLKPEDLDEVSRAART